MIWHKYVQNGYLSRADFSASETEIFKRKANLSSANNNHGFFFLTNISR